MAEDADKLLDACIARLRGEYRCVMRPSGSGRWVKWIGTGWMPVTDQQVLHALRGVSDHKSLAAALTQLGQDSRTVVLPGDPMPELSEEPRGTQPTFFIL